MPAARAHRTLRSIAIQLTMAFCALCPSLADAQVSCADWNTAKFFKEAKAQDITHCVAAGSDPNVRADYGYTPLHSAAANSTEPAVVARLLDAGADPEARGETGLTPLHVAAGGSAVPAVVTALVNAGADLGARNDAGYTPLHAAAAGSAVPEMVTVLVNAGADLEARTESGLTPLHVAAGGSAVPAVVTALVNAGADLEARTESGLTPLHVAARSSVVPEVVSALADAGADLEARTESGLTPLHVAAGGQCGARGGVSSRERWRRSKRAQSGEQDSRRLCPVQRCSQRHGGVWTAQGCDHVHRSRHGRDLDGARLHDRLGHSCSRRFVVMGSLLLARGPSDALRGERCDDYAHRHSELTRTCLGSCVVRQGAYGRVSRRNDVASMEAGIEATWITIGVVGSMYSLLLRKIPEPSDTHRRRHRDVLGCRHCELLRFGLAVFVWLIAGRQWFSSPCSLVRGYGLHGRSAPRLGRSRSARAVSRDRAVVGIYVQIKQQFGEQALAIANAGPQSILALFQ